MQVFEIFTRGRFDTVMHFAAVSYVAESVSQPLLYYHNVTINTIHILEALAQFNVPRLVYSSTCAT